MTSGRAPRGPSAGPLTIGVAFDLKDEVEAELRRRGHPPAGGAGAPAAGEPDDRLEEYDAVATVDAIVAALGRLGHAAEPLGGGRRLVERLLARPPQLVFNIAEGIGGRAREAQVPALCELLGVPVTHSDPLTCAATLDKAVAKRLVRAAGVATPDFAVVRAPGDVDGLGLAYPVIAKPLWEGSSMGIRKASRVDDAEALRALVEGLGAAYGQPVLVEEFLPGVEVTVGVLGTGPSARVLGALEVAPRTVAPERFVYSLEVKRNYQEEVAYHVPPRLPADTLAAVHDLALAAYRALDCRDVGRVDVRLDARGRPGFIEVNPLPGINPVTGDLCILARGVGLDYDGLIGAIVDSARARHGL